MMPSKAHGAFSAELLVALADDRAGGKNSKIAAWVRSIAERFPEDSGKHLIEVLIELGVMTVGLLDERGRPWVDDMRLTAWQLRMEDEDRG